LSFSAPESAEAQLAFELEIFAGIIEVDLDDPIGDALDELEDLVFRVIAISRSGEETGVSHSVLMLVSSLIPLFA
jgi:hypothetical protein